jgi:hypothetical protein
VFSTSELLDGLKAPEGTVTAVIKVLKTGL